MGNVTLLPVGDWRNDGWTLVGATTLYSTWDNDNDAIYAKCPSHKGGAAVTFPIDFSTVPDGAVVTSITVFLRAARVGSTTRTVTVNVVSSDDESRYTTRTVPLTATPATYEIATYATDPRGLPWDVHRINKMRFRLFSYARVLDAVRCYKFFAQVNYKIRPTITVDQPTGTVYTPSPTLSWTYTHTDGDAQGRVDYKVYTAVQAQASTFNPDATPPVFATSVAGDVSSAILPTSLNPDTYYVYARGVSVFGAKSVWVGRTFSVQGPAPAIPGNDNAGTSGTPGVGVATVVPDPVTSSAALTLRDASNLLSVQQADFETSTDALGYVATNCTAVRDSTTYYGAGMASMKLTASSAATMSVTSSDIEISPSTPLTARVQMKTAVTARTANLRILFFDDQFASVAGTITGTGTDATSTWTEVTATGSSPAGAVYARLQIEVASPANAEVHYADHAGLMYGTGSAWSDGGHLSRNLLSSFYATGDDPAPASGSWVAGNIASTVTRVTATGTGANGSQTNRMSYVGASPSIAYRATGATWNSATTGTDFTLNKPAGLVDNDHMTAFVSSAGGGTITPPAGWSLVDSTSAESNHSMWVLQRTGLAADPATWTGSISTSSTRRSAVVTARSGAADVSGQFVAENVRADPDGALVHTTATVTNTDPNAWRVAAFSVRDGVAGGTMVANIVAPSTVPGVAYVGRATKWSTTYSTTSFTINRPSGVISGDLMTATLTLGGSITTVTPPSGWTLVRQVTQTASTGPCTFAVFKRTAGGSEPTSWSGTLSSSARPAITQAVAHRNCKDASLQYLAENTSTSASGNDITTATISNTISTSWRITAFGATTPFQTSWTSSEVSERADDYQTSQTPVDVSAAIFDSNGPVSTGSHARTGHSVDEDWYAAVSWIGLIKGLDTPPAAGANETERADFTTGSADPWVTLSVCDSNAVVPTGATSVTGVFTPGSGSTSDSMLSWIGIIKPAAPVVAGTVASYTSTTVDISLVDPAVLTMAGNKVTLTASFFGSAAGTPYLILDCYRANVLLETLIAQGDSFNTSVWTKSSATFDIPDGTTRIRPQVSAKDRAVSDTVSFDRVGLSFGSSAVWREGTGRNEHPVWSVPQVQYADYDGADYGPWMDLPGMGANPPVFDPLSGQVVVTDHTLVPLFKRKYRVQTVTFGLLGDRFVSGWGPPSAEAIFTAETWWLKDITDPTRNTPIRVVADSPPDVGRTNSAAVFQPLGADYPKVVTEGYKSDTIPLDIIAERGEHVALMKLLTSRRTLFLQSDMDRTWWVRPVGDLKNPIQNTVLRKSNPVRFVSVTFVEVAPEG